MQRLTPDEQVETPASIIAMPGDSDTSTEAPDLVDAARMGTQPQPQTARGRRTREALIAAARTVFERDGYVDSRLIDIAAEAKSVLDSWVRYEGQVKARQQKELADSVIAKIEKELENPKVLDQILKQSVADVERE